MESLTAFKRDLLWKIAELHNPMGLTIKEELEEHYGESINHGRLYPNLDQLVDDGLVRKGSKDERTNEYQLTTSGRKTLQGRLAFIERGAADLKAGSEEANT